MKLKNCIEGRFVRVKKSAKKHLYHMGGGMAFGPDEDYRRWEIKQDSSLGVIGIVCHIEEEKFVGVYFSSLETWYCFLPEMLKRGK